MRENANNISHNAPNTFVSRMRASVKYLGEVGCKYRRSDQLTWENTIFSPMQAQQIQAANEDLYRIT